MTNLIASTQAIDNTIKLLSINPKALPWLEGKRTKQAARDFIGLSKNSKMPSWTFAIPARDACPRGGELAKIEGTVCHGCYAAKGLDAMPVAQVAKQRRWDTLNLVLTDTSLQAHYIHAYTIALAKEDHFRWHSAGDIFSADYARLMATIISHTPSTQHWIPTRQANMAKYFTDCTNLVLRVSDDMVDQASNKFKGNTSGVHTETTRGQECKAYDNNGECGDCRACWNPTIKHISYKLH